MRRIMLSAVVALVLVVGTPTVAHAQIDSTSAHLVNLTNRERRTRGVPELRTDTALTATSCDWNKTLTYENLRHDPQLRQHIEAAVPHLVAWGENLGAGPTADEIHHAWMASPSHNVHILDADLQLVGVCSRLDDDGQLVVTQRFATSRAPATAPASPAPTPTTRAPRPTTTRPPVPAPTTTTPPATTAPAVTEPSTTTQPPTTTTTVAAAPEAPQVAVEVRRASSSDGVPNVGLVAAFVLTVLALASAGLFLIARTRRL